MRVVEKILDSIIPSKTVLFNNNRCSLSDLPQCLIISEDNRSKLEELLDTFITIEQDHERPDLFICDGDSFHLSINTKEYLLKYRVDLQQGAMSGISDTDNCIRDIEDCLIKSLNSALISDEDIFEVPALIDMQWKKITYEYQQHWSGHRLVTITKLNDGTLVLNNIYNNAHFCANGIFDIILTKDEIKYLYEELGHIKNDFPIHYGGSYEYNWEDYEDFILSIYGADGLINESGNKEVILKLDDFFCKLTSEREELEKNNGIENIRWIAFKDIFIRYDFKEERFLWKKGTASDSEIRIISKNEIAIILKLLFDYSTFPKENDSKWMCKINGEFDIYCNSSSYDEIYATLTSKSLLTEGTVCGEAEINRKKRDLNILLILLNKQNKDIRFLCTDGYVYKIIFNDEWSREKCLFIIMKAINSGKYTVYKKWDKKTLDYLIYHLDAAKKWENYDSCYDYRQTYRVFYKNGSNLRQVGIYEDLQALKLQQIPSDQHLLGIIQGLKNKHMVFWGECNNG